MTTATAPAPDSTEATRLIPLTTWHEYHAWPPLGGLRHLVFHSAENGADAWIRRVGRRVLVDERAFFAWAAAQAQPRS